MELIRHLTFIIASISFFTAFYYFILFIFDREKINLYFFLISVSIGFYTLFCYKLYSSTSLITALNWQIHQLMILPINSFLFLLFFVEFTKTKINKIIKILFIIFGFISVLSIILFIFDKNIILNINKASIKMFNIYGLKITYYEYSFGLISILNSVLGLFAIIYIFIIFVRNKINFIMYEYIFQFIGFSFFFISVLNDFAVGLGLYKFIYTTEYGYAILIIIMSIILAIKQSNIKKQLLKNEITLKNALQDKDILIKDIHHRVKNNMALIVSLLSLENSKLSKDKNIIIENSIKRLHILSEIYNHLYHANKSIKNIQSKPFLGSLINLLKDISFNHKKIIFKTKIKDIVLTQDKLIPIGLIINEVVTNSYKYAFVGKDSGVIEIKLLQLKNEDIHLIIKDDGKGIKKDIDINNLKSSGLKLVNILVTQLRGNLEIQNDNGTIVCIKFKR